MSRSQSGTPLQNRGMLSSLILALMSTAVVLVGPGALSQASAAPPTPTYDSEYWYYGTSPDWNENGHTVYTGGPVPTNPTIFDDYPIYTEFVTFGPQDGNSDEYVNGILLEATMTVSGISGATVEAGRQSFVIRCRDGNEPAACAVPSGQYTLTLTWKASVQDGACEDTRINQGGPSCPRFEINRVNSRRIVFGPPPGENPPVADFSWEVTDAEAREVTFTNASTDVEDGSALDYYWDFGDDEDSESKDPVHIYDGPGPWVVRLDVQDSDGMSASIAKTVSFENELVVNSTGDAAATGPDDGCDTGGTVEGSPECTLRAAIEVANAADGGDITFDITGAGPHAITAQTALPALTADTSVDGTTQETGSIEVIGSGEATFTLESGTSTLTGLAIRGAEVAVDVTGGEEHAIYGNRLGTNAAGSSADEAVTFAVALSGSPSVVVSDNQVVASVGVIAGPTAPDLVVHNNTFGIAADQTTPLGVAQAGVLIAGPRATVSENTIRSTVVGVLVVNGSGAGAQVTDNTLGQNAAGTVEFANGEFGVYLDGAPDGVVTGNTLVALRRAAIVSSGTAQYTQDDEGDIRVGTPTDEPVTGEVTGGRAVISDNTVGAGPDSDPARFGVVAWAGSTQAQISQNTVTRAQDGVALLGGAGHRVLANTLGAPAGPVENGVLATSTSGLVVGARGQGNTIAATRSAIDLAQATEPQVSANTGTADPGGADTGVAVSADSSAPSVTGNTLTGFSTGIEVGPNSTVSTNTVAGGGQGS